MKYLVKIAAALGLFTMATTSCVDEIKFGDSFLEKAPGVDITKDTIFAKGEYAREFLWTAYGQKYFALPTIWDGGVRVRMNTGMFETLSDCYQDHVDWTNVRRYYYPGVYNASTENGSQTKFSYNNELVWECVRQCWIFINSVDQVPESEMDAKEKARLKAEAKCIIAERYFDLFRHFGGVPLVKEDYPAQNSYDIPRATVEETVNFITGLLDEAIDCADLPWALSSSELNTWNGRYTKGAAMALKAKVLVHAASPLFNDAQPYYTGSSEAVDNLQVWYGGYKPELWTQALDACRLFFTTLGNQGGYTLEQASSSSTSAYRSAFAKAYFNSQNNNEILISNRRRGWGYGGQMNSWDGWAYIFFENDDRMSAYTPTYEFMEMFPNADGSDFDFDKAVAEKKVFFDLNQETNQPYDYPTRDPRLYETMRVNGANVGGRAMQYWEGGRDNVNYTRIENGRLATGFMLYKFYQNGSSSMAGVQRQWPYLRLAEMYLLYAEALIQNNQFDEAINQINIVRARVGLPGLKESNPGKNYNDKNTMIDVLLRERACELGFEDTRFFDMARYKLKSRFEKELHGLRITRADGGSGEWSESQGAYPRDFNYEVFTLSNPRRYWWDSGFDPKWYLSAFPPNEVNKGYGLTQNPGW
ncbi:MAG: RagB/SusD family nutrient uptake outer membrane protein [Muribaculum sp.]|nr:RagB/SusD family nutrient uptake outer membrane protein [Muribaculum sp.]